MKLLILLSLLILPFTSFSKIIEVYDTKEKQFISVNDLIDTFPRESFIILGEFHNTPLIQAAQAEIIKLSSNQHQNQVSIFWEFLNYTDHKKTQNYYLQLQNNEITSDEFIKLTAGKNNLAYKPIINTAKKIKANFFGANIPRSLKQIVIKKGLASIDPKFIPSHFQLGDESYRSRFVKAMGNHVPQNKIKAYYTAQCLTDSVMADQLNRKQSRGQNFLIAGSFHTDFYNGTTAQLKRISTISIRTVKFIDLNSLTAQDYKSYILGDPAHGAFADHLIVVK